MAISMQNLNVSEFIYDKLGIPAAKKTVAKRAPAELGYVCEGGVRCAVSDVK